MKQTQPDIHTHNRQIQEVLVEEGLLDGRDKECGKYKNIRKGEDRLTRWKCGNIHSCSICRYEHINKIRREVLHNTNSFMELGGHLFLLTLTIPHHLNLSFNRFYEGFSHSTKRLKDSSVWKNWFKEKIDYQFHFNRYETLINPRNGFHLHLHMVLGGWKQIVDMEEVKERLYPTWVRCSSGVGSGVPSYEQGVDIRETINGNYPNKLDKNTDIPMNQETYTPEELEKILKGWKKDKGFTHPDFTKNECRKLLRIYRDGMKEKHYLRVYEVKKDHYGMWGWSSGRDLEKFLDYGESDIQGETIWKIEKE